MTKTIEQTILFKASPKKVYDTYINSKLHAASTGAPAKISAKPNSTFSAHGGYITGKTLLAQANSLIVQSWRGMDYKKTDPDSILILHITSHAKGSQLKMIHTMVPDHRAKHLASGWKEHYWDKWLKFFAN